MRVCSCNFANECVKLKPSKTKHQMESSNEWKEYLQPNLKIIKIYLIKFLKYTYQVHLQNYVSSIQNYQEFCEEMFFNPEKKLPKP